MNQENHLVFITTRYGTCKCLWIYHVHICRFIFKYVFLALNAKTFISHSDKVNSIKTLILRKEPFDIHFFPALLKNLCHAANQHSLTLFALFWKQLIYYLLLLFFYISTYIQTYDLFWMFHYRNYLIYAFFLWSVSISLNIYCELL